MTRTCPSQNAHFPAYRDPMRSVLRLLVLAATTLAVLAGDIVAAHAQSQNCRRLETTLASLERNGDYRNLSTSTQQARAKQQEVQRNESAYVRGGCNDDAKAGRQLNAQCRNLARAIVSGRQDLERLVNRVEKGNAVARQREAALQERARFGCGGGSNTRIIQTNRDSGNLFDRLFGALGDTFGDESIREEEFSPWGNYHTVRTLCVRKSDGFYWPISYSTLTDYVQNDLQQCRDMCPGVDVDLFYYDNPGQEPEQAINIYGERYAALPNAFRFRTEVDEEATCKAQVPYGSVTLEEQADGRSRAIIQFEGVSFPLPLRDPRRQANIVQAALETQDFVDVPLPRRRPAAPGEEPKPVPVTTAASDQTIRVVQFGDKRVRIVGPDTPYVQAVAGGS